MFLFFWVVFRSAKQDEKAPGSSRVGWCMSNTVSDFQLQLRKVGRCVADLRLSQCLGGPARTYQQVRMQYDTYIGILHIHTPAHVCACMTVIHTCTHTLYNYIKYVYCEFVTFRADTHLCKLRDAHFYNIHISTQTHTIRIHKHMQHKANYKCFDVTNIRSAFYSIKMAPSR